MQEGVESWDPWAELEALQARIDALFEHFAERFPGGTATGRPRFFPQCDLYERPDAYVLRMALPGVLEEDLEIAVEAGLLVVRGRRETPPAAAGGRILLRELRDGYFERPVRLPIPPAASQIEAEFAEGILSVTIWKGEEGSAPGGP